MTGKETYELDNKNPIALFSEDPAVVERKWTEFSLDYELNSEFFISGGFTNSVYNRNISGISSPASALFFTGSSISMIAGLPKKEKFVRFGWSRSKNSVLAEAASSESELNGEINRSLSFQYERLISRRLSVHFLWAASPAFPIDSDSNKITGLGSIFKF